MNLKKIISMVLLVCMVATYLCVNVEAADMRISAPKVVSVTLEGAKKIKIKWSKSGSVNGYEIYRKVGDNNYKRIKTVSKSQKSYVDNKLDYGKTYRYKVRAYKIVDDKKVYSTYSVSKYCGTLGIPKIFSVTLDDVDRAKITWNKTVNVSGYVLYCKVADGKYKKIATLGRNKTSYLHKNLIADKKYFYKIKAYKKVGDRIYYGKYSNVKNVKVINTLMDFVKPYSTSNYYAEHTSTNAVTMAGKKYYNGFSIANYNNSYAIFNLEGEYSRLEMTVGNADSWYKKFGTVYVLADDEIVETIEISGDGLPVTCEVYIDNCEKLEFRYTTEDRNTMPNVSTGQVGIVDIKIYK